MADTWVRGSSEFFRDEGGTWMERDTATGWVGKSTRQHGIVTGRPSPRQPVRNNAMHDVLSGAADNRWAGAPLTDGAGAGQGALTFTAEPRPSTSDVLRQHGVPERRASSGEGFLSSLPSVAGVEDPAVRSANAARKIAGIRYASKIIGPIVPGANERAVTVGHGGTATMPRAGTATPFATAMANRQMVDRQYDDNWYATEAAQVGDISGRTGVPFAQMRRATALLSPQKPWDTGHPQDGNLSYPNLVAAEEVAYEMDASKQRAVERQTVWDPNTAGGNARVPGVVQQQRPDRAPDRRMVGRHSIEEFDVPGETKSGVTNTVSIGFHPVTGETYILPQARDNMEKAGRAVVGIDPPHARMNTPAQKVGNFDLALNDTPEFQSMTVRREAAQAYTSDTHDVRSAGVSDYAHVAGGGPVKKKAREVGAPEKSGGVAEIAAAYDVMAMTGRRSAMRSGVSPNHAQQSVWRSVRPPNPAKQQMFRTNVHTGEEKISPAAKIQPSRKKAK